MSECCSSSGVKLIYSCSGVSDVGEISDRVVRALRREKFAQGSCIAAVGAGLQGYVQSAKGADVNIAVDGCKVACSKKILENIGVEAESFIITDMGFEKGKTHVNPEVIETVYNNIKQGNSGNQGHISYTMPSGGCGCGGRC